ncbi:MAG TPA: hypothetical protein PLE99_16180 [Candidatus Thiothrix moscowensis]|uniref:hypothetical protein n=1 Tax=unclassified Thiothrix TaxID=2636184 RepID=UPI0025D0D869|nr:MULTISPECIES: hypothetical protein [unclassified Thiothrix]HRJ54299.1 hypothetical protein [Candidatus Thiothrix moscowensis]HRJ94514.1 hypothetical protein [Candidatus Thiothrix moscowensis]
MFKRCDGCGSSIIVGGVCSHCGGSVFKDTGAVNQSVGVGKESAAGVKNGDETRSAGDSREGIDPDAVVIGLLFLALFIAILVGILFFSGDAQEVSEINPKRVGDYPADVGTLIEGLANTVSRLSGVVGFLTFIVGTGVALIRGNPLMAIPGALLAVGMMVLPKMVAALWVVQ